MSNLPEATAQHVAVAREMRFRCRSGWYVGDMPSLERFGAKRWVTARTTPELIVCLQLSRDKMHHSVGWWRNADYEYCWHLSISARDRLKFEDAEANRTPGTDVDLEDVPKDEVRYWARIIFGDDVDKLWNEPGGTDPRLDRPTSRKHAHIWHLRLFLNPLLFNSRGEPFVPFIPEGEVYHLTRWIRGLTPDKVDR